MNEQYVYGVYQQVEKANYVAEQLVAGGIPINSISLIANDDTVDRYESKDSVVEVETLNETRSIWKRITDFFDFEDYDANEVDIADYRKDLDAGNIILAIQSEFEADAMKIKVTDAEPMFDEDNPNRYEKELQPPHTNNNSRDVINSDVLQRYDANDLSNSSSNFEQEMQRLDGADKPLPEIETNYTDAEMRRLKDTSRADEFGGGPIEVESHPSDYEVTDQEAQTAKLEPEQDIEEEMHPDQDTPPADEFGLNPDNVPEREDMDYIDDKGTAAVQQLDSEVGSLEEDMRRQSETPPSDEFGMKPIDGDNSELLENERDRE